MGCVNSVMITCVLFEVLVYKSRLCKNWIVFTCGVNMLSIPLKL